MLPETALSLTRGNIDQSFTYIYKQQATDDIQQAKRQTPEEPEPKARALFEEVAKLFFQNERE